MSTLDEICRRKVSELIQAVLVAEVDEFLGQIAGVPAKSALLAIETATKKPERSATARRR